MRALVCDPGAPGRIRFQDVTEPSPGPGEALVSVRAVSLNRGELRRLGWADTGWRPGYDVAGVVLLRAGDGSGPPPGTRVVGVLPEGAWAERAAIPTRRLATIPESVSDETAACLPVAGLTAIVALAHGGLLAGRSVLVTGAASGVGRVALQVAALAGARTIASVGTHARTAALEGLDVGRVEVGVDPGGPPLDLALDSIGGATFAALTSRLAPGGTLVTIGASSDEPSTLEVLPLVRRGGISIRAISLFDELERQGRGSADLATLLVLAQDGRLDPGVALVRSWERMAELLDAVGARRVAGKAVALID